MSNLNHHYTPDQVIGRECKNICYSTDAEKQNDFVVITEVVHTKDDRLIPELRFIENPRRPIYATRKEFRKHKEKKTYEKRENTEEFWTTDVNMVNTVQLALGYSFPNPKARLKQICKSPYIYWADMPVTSYLKYKYKEKWKDLVSANRIAVYDVETNEREGTKEPNIMSFVLDDEIHFFADQRYMDRIKGGENVIVEKAIELLSKVPFHVDAKGKKLPEGEIDYRNLIKDYKLFTYTLPTPGQCIVRMFQLLHERLPDLLVAWNHEFDLTKMLDTLERENIRPEDVFCHPDVPERFKRVWFKKDEAKKKTESKSLTKSPADQWHVLYCMASFYCVDAMCLFKKLRVHEGNRPNYKLSTTLETEVGVGKLDLPLLPYVDNLDWHVKAQELYPAEYAVYNIMDNLLIILLDRKTNDLSSAISVLAGLSTYDIFPSLPKRLCVAFTFYLYERGLVIGSVGADIRNAYDEEVIGTDGWIVTLPAYANAENGLSVISEIPNFYSAFRTQVADADLTQAYPTATNMMNQERETTLIELINIQGVSEEWRRICGINLTAGRVNAMEIANELFCLPEKDEVLRAFLEKMGEPAANEDNYVYEFGQAA